MGVKLTFYRENKKRKNNVVGFLGIYIESLDLYLSKLTYVIGNKGLFVSCPSSSYEDRSGKKVYENYYWFGKKFRDNFQSEAKKAIDAYIQEHNMATPSAETPEATQHETQGFSSFESNNNNDDIPQDGELPF